MHTLRIINNNLQGYSRICKFSAISFLRGWFPQSDPSSCAGADSSVIVWCSMLPRFVSHSSLVDDDKSRSKLNISWGCYFLSDGVLKAEVKVGHAQHVLHKGLLDTPWIPASIAMLFRFTATVRKPLPVPLPGRRIGSLRSSSLPE